MRWSIIRLIWVRELRDQLRDRRTVLMVVVLPILIYPLLGVGVLQFANGLLSKETVVGIYGAEYLPARTATSAGINPLPATAWMTLVPAGPGSGLDLGAGAAALASLASGGFGQDYPPLLRSQADGDRFVPAYFDLPENADTFRVRPLPWPQGVPPTPEEGESTEAWLQRFDASPLQQREVALLLVVPGNFSTALEEGRWPKVHVLGLGSDERSQLVDRRLGTILGKWKKRIAQVRLVRQGLPPNLAEVVFVDPPEWAKPASKQAADAMLDPLTHIFPFLLVMWSLTGALYPAVDLCAGEKERGTMETLLISPASRQEIVYGKFLTIWVFSGSTALLNLVSMGLTTALFGGELPVALVQPAALAWCVLLCLPLSAFFSAVCLAVGAYARSSKEGQYYLMPLFLVTMPLIFLTLAPGVELNAFYSMVPVTGVALLLQRLMVAPSLAQVPWGYFVPVLAPTVLYGWLALRWAVSQFQREEVLFREAERLDVGLWLRHLFRDKEPLPSAGQAFFCFGVIMGLRWLALGIGGRLPLLAHAAIDLVAFVIAPPLFMVLLLTTQPRYGLGLRWPPARALVSAAGLVALLVLPLGDLGSYLWQLVPDLRKLLTEATPVAGALQAVQSTGPEPGAWWQIPLVLLVLAPICSEFAFRGFILTGLRRRFHPWTAILLSSFLFAFSYLNVFLFIPTFLLGVILGLVATRSRSILPGMLFHMLYNAAFFGPMLFPDMAAAVGETLAAPPWLRPALVTACTVLAAAYLAVSGYRLWATGRSPWWDELPPAGAALRGAMKESERAADSQAGRPYRGDLSGTSPVRDPGP
jgi:sodium transport system permease protein